MNGFLIVMNIISMIWGFSSLIADHDKSSIIIHTVLFILNSTAAIHLFNQRNK